MPRPPLSRLASFLMFLTGLVLLLRTSPTVCAQSPPGQKPNIVLILADDAGYRDFSFQGSKQFKTPSLDRLAAEGVVCTNAYATAAVCGPSRAGLLTGRYPQRFGYFMNPGPDDSLPLDQTTVGAALQQCGYRTALIGKWHMGHTPPYQPTQRGFDYFYGFLGGHRSYFPYKDPSVAKGRDPRHRMSQDDRLLDESEMDFYTTDLFTDQALAFMAASQEAGQPFFVFLSHNAVHAPMDALESDMAGYDDLDGPMRRPLAGMTAALDRSTGRILDWLDERRLSHNTLVVFTNDNGGARQNGAFNGPLRGFKGEETEGGIRVPMILRWPARLPAVAAYVHPVIHLDLMPTFLAAAGGLDEAAAGRLDGVDLTPYLSGEMPSPPHEALFWQRTNAAVRAGQWKLIQRNAGPRQGACELYDLDSDLGEKQDRIAEHPEVAERLQSLLKAWQADNAQPLWRSGGGKP